MIIKRWICVVIWAVMIPYAHAQDSFLVAVVGGNSQFVAKLKHNLEGTGFFTLAPLETVVPFAVDEEPAFNVLASRGAHLGLIIEGEDESSVRMRLWDLRTRENLLGRSYGARNMDDIAHRMSDDLYETMTQTQGYFSQRLLYVAKDGLRLADWDGGNSFALGVAGEFLTSPRFYENRVIYVGRKDFMPHLYSYDMNEGEVRSLHDFAGTAFAPSFSPDGAYLLLTLEEFGNADIFVMALSSGEMVRLTKSPFTETSASFSPDGGRIVFVSDKSGRAQLYVMAQDGSAHKRLTFDEAIYRTPLWSPVDGRIAFVRMMDGKAQMGLMNDAGEILTILREGEFFEILSWAQGGNALLFAEHVQGDASVRVMNLKSGRLVNLSLPTTDAFWGR